MFEAVAMFYPEDDREPWSAFVNYPMMIIFSLCITLYNQVSQQKNMLSIHEMYAN